MKKKDLFLLCFSIAMICTAVVNAQAPAGRRDLPNFYVFKDKMGGWSGYGSGEWETVNGNSPVDTKVTYDSLISLRMVSTNAKVLTLDNETAELFCVGINQLKLTSPDKEKAFPDIDSIINIIDALKITKYATGLISTSRFNYSDSTLIKTEDCLIKFFKAAFFSLRCMINSALHNKHSLIMIVHYKLNRTNSYNGSSSVDEASSVTRHVTGLL